MAATPLKTTPLRPSKAPNLPIAPVEYSQQYVDQLTNALRLYFAQIDNDWTGLLSNVGGAYLTLPHIGASDSTDQYAGGDDTPTIVEWNTLDSSNGFTLNVSGTATAQRSGIYKIDYSLQFVNTDNAIHDASVWLETISGGVTSFIPNSTTVFSLQARKSAGVYNYTVGYSTVVFELAAGDEVALYWVTSKAYNPTGPVDGIYMEAIPAQVSPYTRPAVPSAIGAITFVSAPTT
jgi:hypothetical protein